MIIIMVATKRITRRNTGTFVVTTFKHEHLSTIIFLIIEWKSMCYEHETVPPIYYPIINFKQLIG